MKIRLPVEERVSDFVKKLIEKKAETSAKAIENTKGAQEKTKEKLPRLKTSCWETGDKILFWTEGSPVQCQKINAYRGQTCTKLVRALHNNRVGRKKACVS